MHSTARRPRLRRRGRTRAEHRRLLVQAVDRLARRLAAGRLAPPLAELAGLATALDADRMWPEAARIRRWLLTPAPDEGPIA